MVRVEDRGLFQLAILTNCEDASLLADVFTSHNEPAKRINFQLVHPRGVAHHLLNHRRARADADRQRPTDDLAIRGAPPQPGAIRADHNRTHQVFTRRHNRLGQPHQTAFGVPQQHPVTAEVGRCQPTLLLLIGGRLVDLRASHPQHWRMWLPHPHRAERVDSDRLVVDHARRVGDGRPRHRPQQLVGMSLEYLHPPLGIRRYILVCACEVDGVDPRAELPIQHRRRRGIVQTPANGRPARDAGDQLAPVGACGHRLRSRTAAVHLVDQGRHWLGWQRLDLPPIDRARCAADVDDRAHRVEGDARHCAGDLEGVQFARRRKGRQVEQPGLPVGLSDQQPASRRVEPGRVDRLGADVDGGQTLRLCGQVPDRHLSLAADGRDGASSNPSQIDREQAFAGLDDPPSQARGLGSLTAAPQHGFSPGVDLDQQRFLACKTVFERGQRSGCIVAGPANRNVGGKRISQRGASLDCWRQCVRCQRDLGLEESVTCAVGPHRVGELP